MTRPSAPRLVVIADHDFAGGDDAWMRGVRQLGQALDGTGGTALQLRVKDADESIRSRLLERAIVSLRGLRITVMVNGSVDEALALGCNGVHWPEAAIPARSPGRRSSSGTSGPGAETVPDTRLLIGASTHSADALRRARRAGADFALFGPVFAPGSKPGKGRGVDALREGVAAAALPVLALGGIDANRVAACLEAGCHGVATVSAAWRGPAARSAILELLDALGLSR